VSCSKEANLGHVAGEVDPAIDLRLEVVVDWEFDSLVIRDACDDLVLTCSLRWATKL
jgi:hypothetical protein